MNKKGKKNVKDIQSALLSKTGFLNREDTDEKTEKLPEQPALIDDDVMEKLEALAEFEKTDTKSLVNKALSHFLRLKSLQVNEALKTKRQQEK